MTKASTAVITQSKGNLESIDRIVELDMLYLGQTHSVAVPMTDDPATLSHESILAAFEASYMRSYSRLLTGIPARILNLRLSVVGRRPSIDLAILAKGERAASVADCVLADQSIFAAGQWHEARIYDRLRLPEGAEIPGPALLVQADATIYVDPWITASVDSYGNIIMTPKGKEMTEGTFNPATTAVLIVDLQNDFLHPEGPMAGQSQTSPEIAALPERLLPLLNAVRDAGGWVVSTQFTLVPERGRTCFKPPEKTTAVSGGR